MLDEREALEAIRAINGSKLGGNCLNVEVSICSRVYCVISVREADVYRMIILFSCRSPTQV